MDIFIAGLGRGGSSLLKVLVPAKEINVSGCLEVDSEAPGIEVARRHNIPVYKNLEEVPEEIKPDIVINVTGVDKLTDELIKKFSGSEIVSGKTGMLIFALVDEARRLYQIYRSLYNASVSLLSKEKQHEVLSLILSEVLRVLNAPAGSIALYDSITRTFSLAASAGMSKKILGMQKWKARKNGLTYQIINSEEQPFVIEDVEKCEIDINPLLKEEGIRFVAANKLMSTSSLLGIIYIDDFEPRELSNEEKLTFKLFAQLAGLALEKFRLIEINREMALTDGLTGLYNHRYFHERLNQEISRAKRLGKELSIVVFDVDNFKKYNDANGHLAGDDALKRIATIIRENIRIGDVAARYGGEEFTLILYDAGKDDAKKVAERIRKMLEEEVFTGEESLPQKILTISGGVATFPYDAENKDILIKKADDALYEAKLRGKNQIVCAGEID